MDFLVETDGKILPVEVKSGKNHTSHAALDNLMSEPDFGISSAWVVSRNGDVTRQGGIIYLPIYLLMFLERKAITSPMIYRVE